MVRRGRRVEEGREVKKVGRLLMDWEGVGRPRSALDDELPFFFLLFDLGGMGAVERPGRVRRGGGEGEGLG